MFKSFLYLYWFNQAKVIKMDFSFSWNWNFLNLKTQAKSRMNDEENDV